MRVDLHLFGFGHRYPLSSDLCAKTQKSLTAESWPRRPADSENQSTSSSSWAVLFLTGLEKTAGMR